MSDPAKSPSSQRAASLGKRVLTAALRDKRRLLLALVVGDVIGERVRPGRPPKRPDTSED